MRLKTRLLVTFLIIILLPLLLSAIAFMSIGLHLVKNSNEEYGYGSSDYGMVTDYASLDELTEDIYAQLGEDASGDTILLENKDYLKNVNQTLKSKASYLLVRKDDETYYTGNPIAAEKIFGRLPLYGYENAQTDAGYYYNDLQKIVKQVDFTFSDGSQGSAFIITRVSGIISKTLLIDMFVAIVFILVFTGVMLTRFIHSGVFKPINELNVAMRKITEGNFDYVLEVDNNGEIGDLYRNYEDMRLRLKESTEENMLNEKQNHELISNITHDLKTPITAIKGYMEGIMDGVADTPEKMERYIKTVYTKANDMDRLINELTYYSGIDSNRIPYNFHRIIVNEYFGDCVEEIGLDLEAQDVQLNYSNLAGPETRVIADPEQLKKVINNIIGNSLKYMDKEKGVIDIRILDEMDSIRVEIEDNGKGIASKDLSKIFERFYRTDASRNSSKGGSGIGLSIVKKIIEDHGGYIWATSKEGEGTCLHFVLRKYREVENNE